MSRPKVSAFIAMSLDGYIAGKNHELDWLERVAGSVEDHGFTEFFESVDTLVLGRRTYDVVLGFDKWYYAEKRVYVLTTRPAAARYNERFHPGPVSALLEEIQDGGGRHVYADGGRVIDSFLRNGAVDQMTITVIPILLGEGIPLFQSPAPERDLELAGCRSFPTGLVQLSYRPKGAGGTQARPG